jgi:hypothetical protein
MIDPVLHNQLINHCVALEYLKDKEGYAARAAFRLKLHGVETLPHGVNPLNPTTLQRILRELKCGERELALPGWLKEKVTSRTGKDLMYERFWTLVDLEIPKKGLRSYCGLAANQVGIIRSHVGDSAIHVCERNPKTAQWIEDLYAKILSHHQGAEIIVHNRDIFEFLRETEKRFNVIDLDLMCTIRSVVTLKQWAQALYRAAKPKAIVNVNTCIGRAITEKVYDALMPEGLAEFLRFEGFEDVRHVSYGYRDRRVPMRSELFILQK